MRGLDFTTLDLPSPDSGIRLVVAMSGGVDSSVAAALLKEAGYDVVGITLQLYDHGQVIDKKNACCAGQDIYDAAQVAEKLGFRHYVLDYESVFRQAVIEDFADSYLRGETPVPCIRCNQRVKFQDLLRAAKDLQAHALVTGHYVQRILGPEGPELRQAHDPKKDQSYFLFATTKEQLDFLRFPLGHLTKEETRAQADRLGLPVKDKPDSQDICFVPNGDYSRVIEKLRPGALEAGDIVDLDGNVVGQHDGVIGFTVGQRKGIGIGGRKDSQEPLYVVKLIPEKHQVVVGPKEALAIQTFDVKELNWLGADEANIHVRIRSSGTFLPAQLERQGSLGRVTLASPEYGISAGQAAVFYEGARVLGGGWICKN